LVARYFADVLNLYVCMIILRILKTLIAKGIEKKHTSIMITLINEQKKDFLCNTKENMFFNAFNEIITDNIGI
jgi:hypothetical protein